MTNVINASAVTNNSATTATATSSAKLDLSIATAMRGFTSVGAVRLSNKSTIEEDMSRSIKVFTLN